MSNLDLTKIEESSATTLAPNEELASNSVGAEEVPAEQPAASRGNLSSIQHVDEMATTSTVVENSDATGGKEQEKDGVASENTDSHAKVLETEQTSEIDENQQVTTNISVGFHKALAEVEADAGAGASAEEIAIFRKMYLAGARDSALFAGFAINQIISSSTALNQGLQSAIDTMNNGNTWLLTNPMNTGIAPVEDGVATGE